MDVAQNQLRPRHLQLEVGKTCSVASGIEVHGQTVNLQSGLLLERQALNVDVQRVLRQFLEDDVAAEVGNGKVSRIEDTRCLCGIHAVIGDAAMAHDEGVDAQVQR